MRRGRAGGVRVAQQQVALAQEEVPQIEDDLLRIERLAGRERRTLVGATAALGAGVPVEMLLPREIAERRGAEGLLLLEVLDRP